MSGSWKVVRAENEIVLEAVLNKYESDGYEIYSILPSISGFAVIVKSVPVFSVSSVDSQKPEAESMITPVVSNDEYSERRYQSLLGPDLYKKMKKGTWS